MTRTYRPGPWVLRYEARPLTVNHERTLHWRGHRDITRSWRQAFHLLALAEKVPHLEACTIEVVAVKPNRRAIPDPGGCAPAAKAAIDGLVDAGVLDDDSDRYVRALTFLPHRIEPGRDALELTVHRCQVPA